MNVSSMMLFLNTTRDSMSKYRITLDIFNSSEKIQHWLLKIFLSLARLDSSQVSTVKRFTTKRYFENNFPQKICESQRRFVAYCTVQTSVKLFSKYRYDHTRVLYCARLGCELFDSTLLWKAVGIAHHHCIGPNKKKKTWEAALMTELRQ